MTDMNDNSGSIPNTEIPESANLNNEKPKKERVEYIDYIKAFAIVCVILGHANFANEALKPWIMRITMAIFFFASGVFLKGNGKMTLGEWKTVLDKKFRALMVPFFLWAVIFTKLSLPNLIKIMYGSYRMIVSSGSSRVLWFLPVQFICLVMYNSLRLVFQEKFKTPVKLAAMAAVFGVGFLLPQISRGYPWGFNSAFAALGFMLMGNVAYPLMHRLRQFIMKTKVGLPVGILTACAAFAGTQFYRLNTAPVSMATGKYGNPALFLIAAVSGIIFAVTSAMIIEKLCFPIIKRGLSYIGRNTFSIYILHLPSVKLAEMLFKRVPMPSWAELTVTCVIAISFSLIGGRVISMFAPALLGNNTTK